MMKRTLLLTTTILLVFSCSQRQTTICDWYLDQMAFEKSYPGKIIGYGKSSGYRIDSAIEEAKLLAISDLANKLSHNDLIDESNGSTTSFNVTIDEYTILRAEVLGNIRDGYDAYVAVSKN